MSQNVTFLNKTIYNLMFLKTTYNNCFFFCFSLQSYIVFCKEPKCFVLFQNMLLFSTLLFNIIHNEKSVVTEIQTCNHLNTPKCYQIILAYIHIYSHTYNNLLPHFRLGISDTSKTVSVYLRTYSI